MALCAAFLASSCANPYQAPQAKPGTVVWMMAPQEKVGAICGHPGNIHVIACAIPGGKQCLVVSRPPSPDGDPDLVEVLNHEVAHCQGWRHPAWPGGVM